MSDFTKYVVVIDGDDFLVTYDQAEAERLAANARRDGHTASVREE